VSIEAQKKALESELTTLSTELEKKRKKLDRLSKVQTNLFDAEPAVGTVIRFSRPLHNSVVRYTFVAYRAGSAPGRWSVTGRKNALNYLGLVEGGNTWDDLLVAIGDADVEVATVWVNPLEDEFEYFQASESGKVFRTKANVPYVTHVRLPGATNWKPSPFTTRRFITENPGSYRRISAAVANGRRSSAVDPF
jgi:hypothetical protein